LAIQTSIQAHRIVFALPLESPVHPPRLAFEQIVDGQLTFGTCLPGIGFQVHFVQILRSRPSGSLIDQFLQCPHAIDLIWRRKCHG